MNKKIAIDSAGELHMIDPCSILFIRAEGAYSDIVLKDSTIIRVSKNMKEVVSIYLSGKEHFFKTHRSWVVNINHIDKVSGIDSVSNYLIIEGGLHKIPITNQHKRELLSLLKPKRSKNNSNEKIKNLNLEQDSKMQYLGQEICNLSHPQKIFILKKLVDKIFYASH